MSQFAKFMRRMLLPLILSAKVKSTSSGWVAAPIIHCIPYSLYILDLSSSVHRHAEKAIFDDSRSLLETEQAYTQQCLNKARGNRLRHLKPGQSQSPPLPRSSSRLYRRQHLHAAHKCHSQRHAISSDDRARQTIRGHGKDRQQGRIEDRQRAHCSPRRQRLILCLGSNQAHTAD